MKKQLLTTAIKLGMSAESFIVGVILFLVVWKIGDKIAFLKAVVQYLEHPQTSVQHPSHGKKRRRKR
jgi:hypothetical protein